MIGQVTRVPNLLAAYATIAARQNVRDLEESALRMRSTALRDVLAVLASGGTHGYDEVTGLDESGLVGLDPVWAAALGRVVGFQSLLEDDPQVAQRLLRSSAARTTRNRESYLRVLAELLYVDGDFAGVRELLDAEPALDTAWDGYLRTDLLNPFTASPYADVEGWRHGFARLFERYGLAAPLLGDDGDRVFDRLRAGPRATPAVLDGPLVSVVMTTFAPSREPLLTSVRSILDQSWGNLEVLLVDDASPPGHGEVLDEVAALDPRIRLVRLVTNGGTYLARNAGIEAARGVLLTGQDDDDWSHPERVAMQAAAMIRDPALPATRSRCLTVNDELVMQRPGYAPTRPNASSLMVRTADVRALGGFLPSRRAADSELHARLEVARGRPALDLPQLLSVVRIRTDSLSRSDFRPGWHHPARRAFRSAFTRWHQVTPPSALRVEPGTSPIPVPDRFAITPRPPGHFDVVIASDWRLADDSTRRALAELATWPAQWRVGMLQLDSCRFLSRRNEPACGLVQDLINAGQVSVVLPDDPVTTDLVVVADPDVLQFASDGPLALEAGEVIVVADHAAADPHTADARFDTAACARHADHLFGRRPSWLPTSQRVRRSLRPGLPATELLQHNLGPALAPTRWVTDRTTPRLDRPVIGHHAPDGPWAWPHRDEFRLVYPDDGSVELRRWGSAAWALERLGGRQLPDAWVQFSPDDLHVRTFVNALDFFVYAPAQGTGPDGTWQAVVEALAAGCVPILPPEFEPVLGDAAVYAAPAEVQPTLQALYADRAAYAAAAARATAWARANCAPGRGARIIDQLRQGAHDRAAARQQAG